MDPVYEENFYFLVRNPQTDTLVIKIMDRKAKVELGAVKRSLDAVYQRADMKLEKQNLPLNLKYESKLKISLELAVLVRGKAKTFLGTASKQSVVAENNEPVKVTIEESKVETTGMKLRLTIRYK